MLLRLTVSGIHSSSMISVFMGRASNASILQKIETLTKLFFRENGLFIALYRRRADRRAKIYQAGREAVDWDVELWKKVEWEKWQLIEGQKQERPIIVEPCKKTVYFLINLIQVCTLTYEEVLDFLFESILFSACCIWVGSNKDSFIRLIIKLSMAHIRGPGGCLSNFFPSF